MPAIDINYYNDSEAPALLPIDVPFVTIADVGEVVNKFVVYLIIRELPFGPFEVIA